MVQVTFWVVKEHSQCLLHVLTHRRTRIHTHTHVCMYVCACLIAYMLLVDGIVKYSGPINFQQHFCG